MVEYATLLSLIALALVGTIGGMAGQVGGRFNAISNTLASGGNGGLGGGGTTVPNGGGGGTVTPPPTTNNGGSGNNSGGNNTNKLPVSPDDTDTGDPDGTAFAVITSDGQLLFYKRKNVPLVGQTFDGHTISYVDTYVEQYVTGVGQTIKPSWNHTTDYQRRSIKKIKVVDSYIKPKTLQNWFYWLNNLTEADISKIDTSQVDSMSGLFSTCGNLKSVKMPKSVTTNVVDMTEMFDYDKNLESLDLSGFDTSKVTDFNMMFYGCTKLKTIGDVSKWDVSKATMMQGMFSGCPLLKVDCSNWNPASCDSYGANDFSGDSPNVIQPSWKFN